MDYFEFKVTHFEEAKKIAEQKPHPNVENLSFWDYVQAWDTDTINILHEINNLVRKNEKINN